MYVEPLTDSGSEWVMQYLLTANSIDILAGNLNFDLLKVSEKKFSEYFTGHIHAVNQFYIKKTMMKGFFTNVTV